MTVHLLQLLLEGRSWLSVTALLLAAVNGTGGKASIALAAHLSLAVEGLGQSSQKRDHRHHHADEAPNAG